MKKCRIGAKGGKRHFFSGRLKCLDWFLTYIFFNPFLRKLYMIFEKICSDEHFLGPEDHFWVRGTIYWYRASLPVGPKGRRGNEAPFPLQCPSNTVGVRSGCSLLQPLSGCSYSSLHAFILRMKPCICHYNYTLKGSVATATSSDFLT